MQTFEPAGNRVRHTGLGALWIFYGLLRIIVAAWLITFEPVATVMFGALLSRVANAELAMSVFHAWYLFLIILTALCGAIGLVAGVMFTRESSNRLAVIASFLALSDLPIGIALGVYTLLTLSVPHRLEKI